VLDGSHIHVTPKAIKHPIYHNRKGFVSQNCLFACNFDLNFTSGWEGLVTDACVYEDACSFDFHTPAGKYFLGDAGYPLCLGYLCPTKVCVIILPNGVVQMHGKFSIDLQTLR
jgi:hypothetical protein